MTQVRSGGPLFLGWLLVLAVPQVNGCTERQANLADLQAVSVPDSALRIFPEDTLIAGYRDILPSRDGGAIALSTLPPFLVQYSPDGLPILRGGMKGAGPQEHNNPWYLVAGEQEGEFLVWDVGTRLLTGYEESHLVVTGVFNPGVEWGTVMADIGRTNAGRPLQAARMGAAVLIESFPKGAGRAVDLQAPLVSVGVPGKDSVWRPLYNFSNSLEPRSSSANEVIGLLPQPLWASCGRHGFVTVNPVAGSISWRREDASIRDSAAITIFGRELTEADKRDFVRQVLEAQSPPGARLTEEMRSFIDVAVRRPGLFPARLPAIADLMCDGTTGIAWLNIFDLSAGARGAGPVWLLLEGRDTIATVRLPAEFLPRRVNNGVIWGIKRDELGVERIATAQVSLPPRER